MTGGRGGGWKIRPAVCSASWTAWPCPERFSPKACCVGCPGECSEGLLGCPVLLLLCCSKIAEAEAGVSVNEKKWLVMHVHVHVQMRLDELRGPPNPWLLLLCEHGRFDHGFRLSYQGRVCYPRLLHGHMAYESAVVCQIPFSMGVHASCVYCCTGIVIGRAVSHCNCRCMVTHMLQPLRSQLQVVPSVGSSSPWHALQAVSCGPLCLASTGRSKRHKQCGAS
jgi:hypothetical protein